MRWLAICLALTVGCASAITPPPSPSLLITPDDVWLPSDVSDSARFCAELFQPVSLYKWRCVSVRTLRTMINGMSGAD